MKNIRDQIKKINFFLFLGLLGLQSEITQAAPIFTSTFGSSGSGNGQFKNPQYIAIDQVGKLYVTDTLNFRVQVFDDIGTYQSKFGTPGTGDGQFSGPVGIAFNKTGDIYVNDADYSGSGVNRVQIFNSNGNYKSQFGNTGASTGQFDDPEGLAIGSNGKIYVSDLNNSRVQIFDSAANFLNTFGTFGTGNGQFGGPTGIAVDGAGKIYVADVLDNRMQVFDSSGSFLFKFGTLGSGPGQFNQPQGVALGNAGHIYVGDSNNKRVQIFDSAGNFLSTFGTNGSGPGQFTFPDGIAIQPTTGKIYVVDAGTVNRRVSIWFDPTEWTLPGTSRLAQLPLNQPLTLNNGFNLQVLNNTALPVGADVTINVGGTFSTGSLTMTGGSITDNANTTVNAPLALTTGTFNSGVGNTFTYAGTISNNGAVQGALTIGGAGRTILSGNNPFTGPTTVNQGVLSIAADNNLGNGGGLIFNGGTLETTATLSSARAVTLNAGGGTFQVDTFGNTTTLSGPIGGTGPLTKTGAGILMLSGVNTYTGLTTVNAGVLSLTGSLGDGVTVNAPSTFNVEGTSLTASNAVTNNGTTNFNTTASAGNSTITNNGTTNFSSAVSSGGATIINNLGATVGLGQNTILGSLSGAGIVDLGGFNLTTGVLGNLDTINGVISGLGGSLTKTGAGVLTLTNANTYTGPTNVNQGTLALNGSLSNSAVTVAPGATLTGNGSMNSLNLSGTVSPGSPVGTLSVANNFTMAALSSYIAELSANGTSDRIAVGGVAQLNGTLDIVNVNPAVPLGRNQSFTILTAGGGVSGMFATLTSSSQIRYRVQYLSNAVNILLNPLFVGAFATSDQSNPARTARYFDTFADTVPVTSDLGSVIQTLDGMLAAGDTAALTNAFNQIQPSQYRETGMLSFLNSELVSKTIQTQQQYLRETHRLETELKQLECVSSERVAGFQKLVNDIHSKGFNFASAKTNTVGPKRSALAFLAPHGAEGSGMPGNQRIRFGDSSAWFQSYGQVHEKNSSHGNKGIRSRTGGISMGADHQVYKNTFVGLFGGLSTSPFEWKGGRGSGHMKSYYGGIYGTWMDNCGLYVDGQVIAGQDRFHSHRNIKFANINRKAKQSHHGNQFSVDTEVGYAWGLPYMTVQPYIDASYMFVRENGFTEKGANSLDFKIKGKTSQFARGAIGTQFYRTFVTCDTLIRPALQLAYVHKQPLGHHEAIKGGLVNEPQTLSVLGDNKKRNQFAPGASLTAQFQNGVYVIGNVSGEIFSGQNAGEALVRVGYDF